MASIVSIIGVALSFMFIGFIACLSLYVSLHRNSSSIYPI